MTWIGWTMLFAHLGLFMYLRVKFIGKKKAAEREAAKHRVENINLKAQINSLEKIITENEY